MYILLFKTNIETVHIGKVEKTLNGLVGISRWSIDIEDSDRVLRVVTTYLKSNQITKIIQNLGLQCEEM